MKIMQYNFELYHPDSNTLEFLTAIKRKHVTKMHIGDVCLVLTSRERESLKVMKYSVPY